MSKAILVMDMPKSCRNCNLRVIGSYNFCTGADGRKIDQMKIINNDIKPDWCPLREMPQKKEEIVYTSLSGIGEKKGWNACIDAILKEGTKYELE